MSTEIILIIINVVIGGLAWFFKRELFAYDKRIERLENEINTIKVAYLLKDDFREFKIELKSMFEDIKQDIHSIRNSIKGG